MMIRRRPAQYTSSNLYIHTYLAVHSTWNNQRTALGLHIVTEHRARDAFRPGTTSEWPGRRKLPHIVASVGRSVGSWGVGRWPC
jgi:hypothetical protein